MTDTGASCHEQLRAAAREDDEDLLLSVIENEQCDINNQDGLGNTALHYAASHGSTNVLEYILCHEDCDVDPINAVERATPLHLAVQLTETELRRFIVNSLLDAGADITIKDKTGRTAEEMVPQDDDQTMTLFKRAKALNSLDTDDIAYDEDDSEEYGEYEEDEDEE